MRQRREPRISTPAEVMDKAEELLYVVEPAAARSGLEIPRLLVQGVDKTSLEHGSPGDAITESHAKEGSDGEKAGDPKALREVRAPVKGSRDAVSKASRKMRGDIGRDEVACAPSFGCSSQSERLSDRIDDGSIRV